MPSGEELIATRFKCRRCGMYFTDVDSFLHCEATPPQEKMEDIRKRKRANEKIQALGFKNIEDFREQMLRRLHGANYKDPKAEALPITNEITKEPEPEPGTPEWYEAHPEES